MIILINVGKHYSAELLDEDWMSVHKRKTRENALKVQFKEKKGTEHTFSLLMEFSTGFLSHRYVDVLTFQPY